MVIVPIELFAKVVIESVVLEFGFAMKQRIEVSPRRVAVVLIRTASLHSTEWTPKTYWPTLIAKRDTMSVS